MGIRRGGHGMTERTYTLAVLVAVSLYTDMRDGVEP